MSGAAAATEVDDRSLPDGASAVDPETERIARANGWRPRDEFRGEAERWVPADVFVARGFEVPAILANRNKALAAKVDDLQRQFEQSRREHATKLDEALDTVQTMTTMLRTSEQRAYDRARREIKAEMEKAVESGDTATWKRLDLQREELENNKPPPADTKPPPRTTTTPPPPTTTQDPAVQRFFANNRWYDPARVREDRDDEMMAYADTIHNGLRTTQPNITMEQNLAIVEAEVRARFPDRFGRQTTNADGQDQGNRNNANGSGGDRRDDSPAVTPSSGSPAPRRNTNRFTFDAMPKESKDAYVKYAKVLEGKGQPLTKEEWAADYWGQFRDDGNP